MATNEISKITLPSGTTYDIKDAQARSDIEDIQSAISGGVHFIGTTTTALTDGSTTNPITINNQSVTAQKGDLVTYGSSEFLWDGTKWLFFGDFGSLGALAFKDSASGSYTPNGDVSKPSFTGSSSSVTFTISESSSGNYQPKGTITGAAFTGASMTSTGTFTPTGDVTVTTKSTSNKTAAVSVAASGTATYTPDGDVAAPTISVKTAGSTTTIKNPTSKTMVSALAVAAPGATAPANAITYYAVNGETLSLYQIGATTAASISTSNVTVKNGDAEYEATAPAFTGTPVRLVTGNIAVPSAYTATFDGDSGSVSVTGTTTGSISQGTFTGTKVSITGTTTAAGDVSKPSFTGTPGTVTVS